LRNRLFDSICKSADGAERLWIGVGLAILIAAAVWPAAPIVTAMAFIALGATEITLARFRGTAAFLPVVIIHAVVYAALYGLFFGAKLHGAHVSISGLGIWALSDLAISVIPISVAIQGVSRNLRQSLLS
jgi:hypothetical protein